MCKKPLGVYIHIPFCVQKCRYCDFLSKPAPAEVRTKYVDALRREIREEAARYKDYVVDTVFFGGGTPSILEASELVAILEELRKHYHVLENAEITTEMNPGRASKEKLLELAGNGFNRLSIGLQSTQDSELRMLGRIHTYAEFLETYHGARDAGFKNINIDLMSALPGQSMDTYAQTLDKVIALRPEHISAYSLIIEEGTYLYNHIDEFPPVPSEDEDRQMYQMTKDVLAGVGYNRYEISNYALDGFECQHNIKYWTRYEYVGFGLGASSMVGNTRWKNTQDMRKYISDSQRMEDVEVLTLSDCMEEYMFLGLRMMKGVSESDFKKCFDKDIYEVYETAINKWKKLGGLFATDGQIALTEKGIDISNQIFVDFLIDDTRVKGS